MRYLTYINNKEQRAGISVGDTIVDAGLAAERADLDTSIAASTRTLLRQSRAEIADIAAAAEACASAGDVAGDGSLELGPPVPDPEKIICVGLNYPLHADEFGATAPPAPNVFAKFRPSLTGPTGPIRIPPTTNAVDYEAELAIVIGREGKDVAEEDALDYVAGCMAFNDVTARDLQAQTSQWTAGKAIDTFAPCGPVLVSLDELGDLENVRLRTRLNGNVMQDASTSEMIFPVVEIVSFLSRLMTLVPGDIIATGTPDGVGFTRDPAVYLTDGDVVEVEVDGVGTLRNPVVAMRR